jgi:hypothetical protein
MAQRHTYAHGQVKKLRDRLNERADDVHGLKNRKFQLQKTMEERALQIRAQKELLRADLKMAQVCVMHSACAMQVSVPPCLMSVHSMFLLWRRQNSGMAACCRDLEWAKVGVRPTLYVGRCMCVFV